MRPRPHAALQIPVAPRPRSGVKRHQFGVRRKRQSWFGLRLVPVLLLVSLLLGLWFVPASIWQPFLQRIGFTVPREAAVSAPLQFDYISSPFGKRWGRMHQGIDLAARSGTPIYASSPGTVIHSGWEDGYGKSVVIDHGHGVQTRYAHCSRLLVRVGAKVRKGGLIANVVSTGHSTGPHLHFEVIVEGVRKNPAWYYRFTRVLPEQGNRENWLADLSGWAETWIKRGLPQG